MKAPLLVIALLSGAVEIKAQEVAPPPAILPIPTATPKAASDCPTGDCNDTRDPSPLPAVPPAPPPEQIGQAEGNPNVVLEPPPLINIGPSATPAPTSATTGTNPTAPTDPFSTPVEPIPAPPEDPSDTSGVETPGGSFVLEAPGGVTYDQSRGLALANGAVTFRYREFLVNADRGLVDYNTNTATMVGNLTVTVRGQKFTGNTLVFNLDTGNWRLSQLQTTFPPSFFPESTILSPVYIKEGTVVGENDTVRGENFKFSSCDRDQYYITTKRVEFYRDPNTGQASRIVLRRNSLHLFGAKILALPVYVISLLGERSRRQPLQSTFGQNDYDGFFVKSVYDLRANSSLTDSVLIDALQKRGLGLGLQREWAKGGLLYLYAVSGQDGGREINARVNRDFRLTKTINANLKFDSTQNSSQTGTGYDAQNGALTFVRSGEHAKTNVVASFDSSDYGLGSNENQSLRLTHDHDFGSGLTLRADAAFNRSSYGTGLADVSNSAGTNDANLLLSKTAKAFDLFLRAELHDDIVNNTTYQLERLPELTLQSSSQRLNFDLLDKFLPGNFTLGMGQFNEPNLSNVSGTTTKSRADFFYNFRERTVNLLGKPTDKTNSIFRLNGNFEQAFYSDSTARYLYSYNANLANKLGPFTATLNYAQQETAGYTPFLFDLRTPTEYYDYNLAYQPSERLRLNVSGGRDMLNDFTRDVLARFQWSPSKNFYTSLGTSYDPRNGDFGDLYGNFRLNRERGKFLGGQYALGVRYDPTGRGLTRANASADIDIDSKTRFQAIAGYDGYGKTFDIAQFRVSRDIGCFNVYATYDSTRSEFRLDLAIKAFPFADSRFGRNQFSEGFDAAVGDIR